MKKFKKIILLVSISILIANTLYAQIPAQLNVKIVNFPFLSVERFTFFESDNELKVEKITDGNFLLTYYGKTPKLFYINFRPVLISPGDSVDYVYTKLNSDPNNSRDTIIAKGKNNGNYIFSNAKFFKMKPLNSYPNFNIGKYEQNVKEVFKYLSYENKKLSDSIFNLATRFKCNGDLTKYLVRKCELELISELLYYGVRINYNPAQKKIYENLLDSTFLNTHYDKSDTVYSYFMEKNFQNYFSYLVKNRFNNINSEKDMLNIVGFVNGFPDHFIREYFKYFLISDYKYNISKYKINDLDSWRRENPYLDKTRNEIMKKEKIYN